MNASFLGHVIPWKQRQGIISGISMIVQIATASLGCGHSTIPIMYEHFQVEKSQISTEGLSDLCRINVKEFSSLGKKRLLIDFFTYYHRK
jgi:hypothetical protein